jgi:SAM-dependent methyltransferase
MKNSLHFGPDVMTGEGRKKFFDFYRTHSSRALVGFLKDVARSDVNRKVLSAYLARRKSINCLIMGCSHWANPRNTASFFKKFKKDIDPRVTVLDALPDALDEIAEHRVDCLPLVSPAQQTPFLSNYFDVIISDCLLTCCSFDQHEPVIKEMSRVVKKNGLLILGVVHSEKNTTFRMTERPIMNYCRPFADYKEMLGRCGFIFHPGSSVETRLPGEWSRMKISNSILRQMG